jgi:hypothetical protein
VFDLDHVILRGDLVRMRSKGSYVVALAVLVIGLSLWARGHADSGRLLAQSGKPEPEQCASLVGTVVDDADQPIEGIEVELISGVKNVGELLHSTKHQWTDKDGRYQFKCAQPGEYHLAIQKRTAPDASHPFAGVYFPSADNESQADRLLITASSSIVLPPTRLRRLQTIVLNVSVVFADGTRPGRSNLLFHNVSYPEQGVIGDTAPEVREGRGQFTLPKGFEYEARAAVRCDAGAKIETRESRPVQRIRVEDESIPEQLTFTISGAACKLWSPK